MRSIISTIIDVKNRDPALNDMMYTELKYYCMNNVTCLHFSCWFEIAIPDVFTPLQCRSNQPQFVWLHVILVPRAPGGLSTRTRRLWGHRI